MPRNERRRPAGRSARPAACRSGLVTSERTGSGRMSAVSVAEIRVFGSFEVRFDDHVVRVGSPKLRLLLATLTAHANCVVSADRLVDVLWGPSPPDDPYRTV